MACSNSILSCKTTLDVDSCCSLNKPLTTKKSVKIRIVLAHVSGSITLALFIAVFVYHFFTELVAKTKLWKAIVNQWSSCRHNSAVFHEFIGLMVRLVVTCQDPNQPSV